VHPPGHPHLTGCRIVAAARLFTQHHPRKDNTMANSLQFHLWIKNRSSKTLTFREIHLDHGNFNNPDVGAKQPAASIPPKSEMLAMVVTGAETSATGTEGWVTYNVEGTGQYVKMYWDVPWSAGSQNTCSASSSSPDSIVWVADPGSDYGRVLSTEATFAWID
jgi:hypothetical protein